MPDNNEGFFSDPKTAISLLLIVIAILSLIWTLANQWKQNKRWDALNLARIELEDEGFIIWKEMSKEEILSTKWGYEPSIFQNIEERRYIQRYQMINCLAILDLNTRERVPNSAIAFTLSEVEQEVARLGLLGKPERAATSKMYQIQFKLKNMGATRATDMRVKISVKSSSNGLNGELFLSDQAVDLYPSGTMNASTIFYLPVSENLPNPMNFNVNVTYKPVDGSTVDKSIPVTYDSKRNFWSLGL